MEETRVAKVLDSEPEEFMLITCDFTRGGITYTGAPLSETAMRDLLLSNGMPAEEIQTALDWARENPA